MNRRMLFTANLRILAVIVLVTVAAPGCVTTGSGDQVTNTVFQTHKIVSKLDQDLTASVNNLNTTAADLNAKVTASEQQMRDVQGTVGENQKRLEQMQTQLATLMAALYKQFNMSGNPVTASIPPTGVIAGPPKIGEPGTVPVVTPTGESPVGAPVVADPTAPPADPVTTAELPPADPSTSTSSQEETSASDKEIFSRGQIHFKEKDFDGALKSFSEYLDKYPQGEKAGNAQFWKAESVFQVGQNAKDQKKYEEAIGEYKKYRSQYPSNTYVPYAMYNQAVAHLRLNQKTQAVELLNDLVSKYPATEKAVVTAQKKLKELTSE